MISLDLYLHQDHLLNMVSYPVLVLELWTKSESTTNVDWIELQERREQRRLAKINLQSSPANPLASQFQY